MTVDIAIYWLIFAAVCFGLEALGLSGIGFFFAGLGAVSLAVLMQTGTPEHTAIIAQFAWFFGFTALWAAIFWKPIKQYRMRKRQSDYSNIVGDRAIVVETPLTPKVEGKVKWSGAVMLAELVSDSEATEIAVDTAVVIKKVKGNKLFVDVL